MNNEKFDGDLLDAGGMMKSGLNYLITNGGKIIAVITLVIAALVTFTNITFQTLSSYSFISTLALMLLASYIMFFSLEDAGERLAEESEIYKQALEKYKLAREKITPSDIPKLRTFCTDYSREELAYRKKAYLCELGYSEDEYEKYLNCGSAQNRRAERTFRKVKNMRAVSLTPQSLLNFERVSPFSELINPENYKFPWLLLQLVPTTLCMAFTVSVILTVKDGMTPSDVIDGIMKLSALPIVGFRGYSEGYSYVKNGKSSWLETKARLLESFSREKQSGY